MRKIAHLLSVFLLIIVFCSCQSTRVYVHSKEQVFENNSLVEERTNVTRLDYEDEACEVFQKKTEKSSSVKRYYDLSSVYNVVENTEDNSKTLIHFYTAEKTKKSKSEYEDVVFSLIESDIKKANKDMTLTVLGQKLVRLKTQDLSSSDDIPLTPSVKKGDKFSSDDEQLFLTAYGKFVEIIKASQSDEGIASNAKIRTENSTEKIKVLSTPNSKYILYSAAGKPFVVAGASLWNALKCFGYAVINFSGGYNLMTGNSSNGATLWVLPDFNKAKEKAATAKEANRIKYYPEYHLPFTNNHIIVDKYNREIEIEQLVGEDAENITAIEHYEYDNTMSVSLSAKADAQSTAATAGLVGTIVTIPVSVVTWVAGAAYGIYSDLSN